MNRKELEQSLHDYLCGIHLMDLRVVGRQCGVAQPAAIPKEKLVNAISDIIAGKSGPAPKNNRGAPAKQTSVDPRITDVLEKFRLEFQNVSDEETPEEAERPETRPTYREDPRRPLVVASSEKGEPPAVNRGILEVTQGGYGFTRAKNCQPSPEGDVFIPSPVIHSYRLREGDVIACTAKPRQKNDSAAVDEILSVNGLEIGRYEQRPLFDNLTADYAREKIALSENCGETSLRMLDLFAPIGKGQRALIIAPPKAGKTTLLKSIAGAISENHREINLIILLIDERPEEVTDIRMTVKNAEVVYSTFDEGAEHHIRAAELTLAHAKRMAELGKDVVILLDSITKLTRAYNNVIESTGKTLTGGLDAGAFAEPKRFFGAARNTVEAGSLTILATALVETGSRMDDIIYEEFKGTGNADIFLSRDLAERRIFPAIDIRRSGTRKEEMLLSKEELAAVYKLRERGLTENVAGIIDMLKKTGSNGEFINRLPEWMKIFKNTI